MTKSNAKNANDRKKLRKMAGITQAELAQRAECSQGSVSSWEQNYPINRDIAARIEAVINREIKNTAKRLIEWQIGA